jgi:hypothetical protein
MRETRVCWLISILMAGELFLGIGLAIAHHLFYASRSGQIFQSQDQQQWNIRISTGLPFLVKVFLASSPSLAYTRLLWYTLKSPSFEAGGIRPGWTAFAVVRAAEIEEPGASTRMRRRKTSIDSP